jgi:hypothetical protein
MKCRLIFAFFLLTTSFSCDETDQGNFPSLYLCNAQLGCGEFGENVPYCTWGYKFGGNNPYSPSGPNIPGPGTKATMISYRFMAAGIEFRTSLQDKAVSFQFSEETKSKIRTVISQWSSVADIDFVEKASTETTDITFVSAFIPLSSNQGTIGGLGYPSFTNNSCRELAGLLVLSPKFEPTSRLILHELGHVLGLGHVSSQNVMNPTYSIDHLQSGDIKGIQSIYGSR